MEFICALTNRDSRFEYVAPRDDLGLLRQWYSRRVDTCPDLLVHGGDLFTLVGFYTAVIENAPQYVAQHANILAYAVL